jgi:small nuclear ribonucleoprotein (snRNP)-like protein
LTKKYVDILNFIELFHFHSQQNTNIISFFFLSNLLQITVDLKNDIKITGTLKSVDQFLNLKLDNIQVDTEKYPHFIAIKNLFLRGTNIRYIHLNPAYVDTNLLQDASRREAMASAGEKIAGR